MALIKVYVILDKGASRGKSPKSTIQGETTEIDEDIYNNPKKWKKEKQKIISDFLHYLRGKNTRAKRRMVKSSTIANLPARKEKWKDGIERNVPRNIKGRFTGKITITPS